MLRLKTEVVLGAMSARGLSGNEQLSRILGISLATTKRVMGGQQAPSGPFIAALRLRLGLEFHLAVEAIERAPMAKSAA